jgi:hypothetical protein
LEDRNRVVELGKEFVQTKFVAVGAPESPVAIGGASTRRNDPGTDLVLYKAEIRAESIGGGTGESCQGCGCGKTRSK